RPSRILLNNVQFFYILFTKGKNMAAAGNRNARGESLKTFKRRHILDAARRLFDARGMEGLNMRAIADEAGYSLGAAYAYFRTKEEIQIELLAATFAE